MKQQYPRPSPNAARRIIETVRRGFQAIGLDVRRYRPGTTGAIGNEDIVKAILALRERARVDGHPSDEAMFLAYCAARLRESRAQLFQDLFVLYHSGGKRDGYFVEFGATDGITFSNTILLEQDLGWKGIVAEPARYWHQSLFANRKCHISTKCIWHSTGETLIFNETRDKAFSTIDELSYVDSHWAGRTRGTKYEVETLSLLDLLEQGQAPTRIDYLSVDTEGSELEILSAFDFNRYDIRVITVEHNFTSNRERLHDLMVKNGYSRKFETLSDYDDWYVRAPSAP